MKLRAYFILVFCFLWMVSLAQPYLSAKGSFQVDQKRGCAPLTVTLTQLISPTFTAEYNYEGGTTLTLSKTHTFNNPGTYNVLAIYNGLIPNSTDNSDNITIIVTENIQPAFEISTCSNREVSIKVLETKYNQYLVDFDNDNTVDSTIPASSNQTATFQYPLLTSQTITVRGRDTNGADNCSKKSLNVTPLTALPPATINTLTVTNSTSIKLDYTPATNIQYRGTIAIDNASAFQLFQSFNSAGTTPQSLTLTSLTTDDHYYCFLLNSYDLCNNTNVPSNTICSANFDLNFASNVNQLSWATEATGITNFTIQRDKVNYQNTAATTFSDIAPNIICNQDYCYTIVTNYTNGSKSISLEKCGTSFSSDIPGAIENASAAIDGQTTLKLNWIQDPAYTAKSYSINRSSGGSPFNSLGSSNTTSYIDITFSIADGYCYTINYSDVCDNMSPDGNLVCPILLAGSLTNQNFVQLAWSAYQGWKNGVKQYQVTKLDVNGNQLSTYITTSLNLEDTQDDPSHQVVSYLVTAIPNDLGLSNSISNLVTITKQARLIFPTAFTPNKDQLNDSFTVIGQYVDNMTLQIFDRWGTLIFSTERNESWDGTQQGRLMPESTYIWKAHIKDLTGKESTKMGSVALLRK